MLDLDNQNKKNIDYIKADGKKFYVSPAIPAKLIFSMQAMAQSIDDNEKNIDKIQIRYNEMMGYVKQILNIDKRNKAAEVESFIDNLTIEQMPLVIEFINSQITKDIKKKAPKNIKSTKTS